MAIMAFAWAGIAFWLVVLTNELTYGINWGTGPQRGPVRVK